MMKQFFDALTKLVEPQNCCFIQDMQGHTNEAFAFKHTVERTSAELILTGENSLSRKKKLAIINPSKTLAFTSDSKFLTNIINRLSRYITIDGWVVVGCTEKGISHETAMALADLGWYVRSFIPLEQSFFDDFAPILMILKRQESNGFLFLPSKKYLEEEPQKCADLLLNGDVHSWTQHKCLSARKDFKGYAVEHCRNNINSILEHADGVKLVELVKILKPTVEGQAKSKTDCIFRVGKFLSHDYQKIGPNFSEIYNFGLTSRIDETIKNDELEFLVDSEIIADYLNYLFDTELGKWILGASGVHLHDVMDDANNCIFEIDVNSLILEKIPFPDEVTMQEILSTRKNLSKLKSQISRLENKLILEPDETETVSKDAVNLLNSIKLLTAADEVHSLTRSGESKLLEFKETLSWDVRRKEKSKKIELSVLKTVAGFLNSDGGTLLIGISDTGEILGLKNEMNTLYKGSEDRFLLHLKNLLKEKVGENFYPFLDWFLIAVKNEIVLRLDVQAAPEPAFIDDVFYVRTNPATDQLSGKKLHSYLKQRFPL